MLIFLKCVSNDKINHTFITASATKCTDGPEQCIYPTRVSKFQIRPNFLFRKKCQKSARIFCLLFRVFLRSLFLSSVVQNCNPMG